MFLGRGEAHMKDPFYSYFIRSGWPERVEAPAAIGAKFVKTLDALSGLDSIFAVWVLFDKLFDTRSVTALSLANARSRISEIVENNVTRNEIGEVSLVRGYHANARAGEFRDRRSVKFSVTAGGRYENGTKLAFGEYDVPPDLAIVTYPLFKAALLAINAIWQAPWACAQAFRSGAVSVPTNEFGGVPGFRIDSVPQVPSEPAFPYSFFHIPWIAYLSPELAVGLKVTSEILTEHLPDGGLLMSVTMERFDPANLEHVRRARVLAELMIERTGYQPGRQMYTQ
jgi:hypothetical protein